MDDGLARALLLARAHARLCALPLEHVIETMRPLPIEPGLDAPDWIRGVAIIRGVPVPVLDIARLFGATETNPHRFITVRAGGRVVALAVDDVVGVRSVPVRSLVDLPPLLESVHSEYVAAISVLDAAVLLVLDGARLAPDLWELPIRDGTA